MKAALLLCMLLCAGCTVVHYHHADGGYGFIVAPAQSRVEVPQSDQCGACPPSSSCEACAPLVVDATIASWWGTSMVSIATAFFAAVQILGWP